MQKLQSEIENSKLPKTINKNMNKDTQAAKTESKRAAKVCNIEE